MAEISVISTSTVIRGSVRGHGSLRIDGRVQGNVEVSGDVFLGPDAEVRGNIVGQSLSIAGSVDGDLTGSDSVMLESSARVVGDLRAPRIGIGPGAQIRGSVQTDDAPRANPMAASNAARALQQRPALRPAALPVRPAPQAAPAAKAAPLPVPAKKAAPPPPVVSAPRLGAKGRKKHARR